MKVAEGGIEGKSSVLSDRAAQTFLIVITLLFGHCHGSGGYSVKIIHPLLCFFNNYNYD
jgi:hypothetical protein